ncbi:hypothetical protein KY328_02690 [Candidatus Woesearchaeota archaeon]|nr:hypothetical protein [Candidatus Woesearchaeota archaeon]MBW3021800.1 hypothetical protein [Candidatus Woesearchaeota archaeon]
MKKILFVLCVVALLVLAGCGGKDDSATQPTVSKPVEEPSEPATTQPTKTTQPSEPEEPEATQTAEPKEEPKPTSSLPELSSAIIEGLENSVKGVAKVAISPPSQKAKSGDTLVYGLGIYNAATKERTFRISSLEFVRAVDNSNNVIEVSKNDMDGWILTDFDDVILDSYETEVIPFYVKVRGADITPGAYEFEMIVHEAVGDFLRDEYGKVSFFIKVE